jgi:hypothetical protein
MRKITIAVATALVLGALTIAIPKLRSNVQAEPVASPAAPQIGPKTCKNVKFKFTNQRSDKATIRIAQVKYHMLSSDYAENVHTTNDCKYNATCTTTGDNLGDALDRDLSKLQLVYQFLPPTVGAKWSELVQTPIISTTITNCSSNNTYDVGTIPPK